MLQDVLSGTVTNGGYLALEGIHEYLLTHIPFLHFLHLFHGGNPRPCGTQGRCHLHDRPLGTLCPLRSVPFLTPLVWFHGPRELFLAAYSFLDTVNSNPVTWD